MYNQKTVNGGCPCQNHCPCRYEPIVLPVREYVADRYCYVEQPVICPINRKIVNHYCPRPVYYATYTQSEETVCEGQRMNQNMQ